jgi:hypothetical protein
MSLGFVYILSNPAMPGYVKIGYTMRVPDARVGELSGPTGVPQPFVLEFWCLTEEPEAAERDMHETLIPYRVTANREFFQLSVHNAISIIEKRIKVAPSRYVRVTPAPLIRASNGEAPANPVMLKCPHCGAVAKGRVCWSCGRTW